MTKITRNLSFKIFYSTFLQFSPTEKLFNKKKHPKLTFVLIKRMIEYSTIRGIEEPVKSCHILFF